MEIEPAVIYLLRPYLRILYCNLAWDRFASENNGKNLNRAAIVGTSVMDVLPEPLSNYYESGSATVKDTAGIWEHSFEGSSPACSRLFHLRVLRLFGAHLVIENSLHIEALHDSPTPQAADPSAYIEEQGIVTMCCHCRRTRRVAAGESAIWVCVPRVLTERPAKLSISICQICRSQFLAP